MKKSHDSVEFVILINIYTRSCHRRLHCIKNKLVWKLNISTTVIHMHHGRKMQ